MRSDSKFRGPRAAALVLSADRSRRCRHHASRAAAAAHRVQPRRQARRLLPRRRPRRQSAGESRFDSRADAENRAASTSTPAARTPCWATPIRRMTQLTPYKARGVASWYGKRYHGQKTSSGEVYDMYAMTAAHTLLPLPSYARVTNVANGKSVVVRVNDRGPFHEDRLIDLSYAAAHTPRPASDRAAAWWRWKPSFPAASEPPPVAPPLRSEPAPVPAAVPPSRSAAESGRHLSCSSAPSRRPKMRDAFLRKLRMDLAWLADSMQVYSGDGLYKVHAGPYANREEAEHCRRTRRSKELGFKAFVLESLITNRTAKHAHTDLRLHRLRHHHGVPRPLQESHPSRPDSHPQRRVPGARHAPRVRRLRRQHRLFAEDARRRSADHGDRRATTTSPTPSAWTSCGCRRRMCARCRARSPRRPSSPPTSTTTRSPRSIRAR